MRSDYKVQLQGAITRCNWTIFHSQLHVVFRLLNQLVPLQLLHLGKPLPFVVPWIFSEQRALFAVESLNLPPTAIEDSSCEFQLRGAIARCDWKLQLPVQMADQTLQSDLLIRAPVVVSPAHFSEPSPAAHDGRRLRRASSEKKAVRPPSGYPYDPSGYGACFGAKWRLPGRAGAGRCRRTPEQG
jgi:hypothetical protein